MSPRANIKYCLIKQTRKPGNINESLPQKIQPTFAEDTIICEVMAVICYGQGKLALLRNPREYKQTVFQSNSFSSCISNCLKTQFREIQITKISLEGPLTLKYNDKCLNVNNINYIIITLFKISLLLIPTSLTHNG